MENQVSVHQGIDGAYNSKLFQSFPRTAKYGG